MASEILDALFWLNVTLCVGIVPVLLARKLVRRRMGARAAYALWLIPVLTGLVWLLPAPEAVVAANAAIVQTGPLAGAAVPLVMASVLPGVAWESIFALVWALGAAATCLVFIMRQRAFQKSLGSITPAPQIGANVWSAPDASGPFVLGFVRSRIVVPANFQQLYSADEQALMLAHERAHVRRLDPAVALACAILRAVCWFNPLVHAGAKRLSEDQELACDAEVLAGSDRSPKRYAQLILSHATPLTMPGAALGLFSNDTNFLKERVVMLKREKPGRGSKSAGQALFVCAVAGAALALTLVRPADAASVVIETTGIDDRNAKLEEILGPEEYRAYVEKMTAVCERAKSNFVTNALTNGLTSAQLAMLVCVGLPG